MGVLGPFRNQNVQYNTKTVPIQYKISKLNEDIFSLFKIIFNQP